MPLQYDFPPTQPPFRQGEIVHNLLEISPTYSEDITELCDESKSPKVVRVTHPMAVIVTQDCDLRWDWMFRNSPEKVRKNEKDENKLLTHIHFCDLFEKGEIRGTRGFSSPLWERVQATQDERYHRFKEGVIGDAGGEMLSEVYVDFKRVFSLPSEYAYWLVTSGFSTSKAVIAEPYLRDFIHRLFSYLSRVAVPED